MKRMFVFGCGLLALACARAGDVVYRWVDDSGRVNFADAVPEKYRKVAKVVDATPANVVPGARRASEPAQAATRGVASEPGAAGTVGSLSGAPVPAPGKANAPGSSCAAQWQAYFDSQDCFAPYRIFGGAVKPEAFAKCTVVPDPNPHCPLPITAPGS